MASVGLQALGDYRLGGLIPLNAIFNGSLAVGRAVRQLRSAGARELKPRHGATERRTNRGAAWPPVSRTAFRSAR